MQWNRFTIDTTTEAVDLISSMLDELGVEGIEIEDNIPLTESETKGMFIDILPELGPDDGTAKVSFYLDVDVDPEELLAQVREGLEELKLFVNIGEGTITESQTEDKDWMNNWKEYFKPFTVDDILIKPTWEEIPEEHKDKLTIEIDPGTAFGTGTHETTQLCIRQIRKWLKPGDTVLDVGTGSGILAIAALKLGAGYAFGTDLDENAVTAAMENAEVNGITAEQFKVIEGNIIDDEAVQAEAGFEQYEVAVANILAPVIIMLQGEVAKHIKHGGVFITSGIINTWEDRVKEAFAENDEFEVIETTYQGEWVSVTARRMITDKLKRES
ncbi:MAG: 50S ribosomal protein L11 methyltransferase [Lachnospiraceae bacterium]|nr:50S ribosomal protein L11 methyltransferase [Lachnospiraceae bacterium]